jgi:hypothetical protein
MIMNEELEPEILSYREFKNRETLLAWERRRRAFESQAGRRSKRRGRGDEFMKTPLGSHTEAPPPR